MTKNVGIFLLLLSASNIIADSFQNPCVGYFKKDDPQLHNLKWCNWGSRPYEYKWVSEAVSVRDKKVLDLGIGLPSEYNWYKYVVDTLKPSYYVGIDIDGRMVKEVEKQVNYEVLHMDMSDLKFDDKIFDVAYCISTYEHMEFETFMKAMQETHRVLKDNGILVLTLDEEWDVNQPFTHDNGWNILEQSLVKKGVFNRNKNSFGLPMFLTLIKDLFIPVDDNVSVDLDKNEVKSKDGEQVYYKKINKNAEMLNSGLFYNSCVSFAILKKI